MKKKTAATRGEVFRASVAAEFDVAAAGPAWSAQLDEVCRALDSLESLEARVEADGLMVDALHQKVAHPLIREIRQQRLVVSKLLQHLSLNNEPAQTARARRAAQARWSR